MLRDIVHIEFQVNLKCHLCKELQHRGDLTEDGVCDYPNDICTEMQVVRNRLERALSAIPTSSLTSSSTRAEIKLILDREMAIHLSRNARHVERVNGVHEGYAYFPTAEERDTEVLFHGTECNRCQEPTPEKFLNGEGLCDYCH